MRHITIRTAFLSALFVAATCAGCGDQGSTPQPQNEPAAAEGKEAGDGSGTKDAGSGTKTDGAKPGSDSR